LGKSFIICFTGVDGSGKTTHAKSLIKFLDKMGYCCKYVWGGYRPFLSYTFFILTKLLGYWKKIRKNAYTNPLEYAPRNIAEKLGVVYRLFIFLDFQIKALLKIRLPLTFKKVVICDRYIYDLLIELELSNISSKRFTTILSKTLPQPLITFLLDTPDNLASHRRGFSIEELAAKRRAFQQIGKVFDLVTVDSSKDFSSNHKQICTLTMACIQLKKGVNY
jgi:dTMP kinase